jgi:hypothetical protein
MDRSVKVSRRLVLVALVLIGPIVALTPLAYSTPLDPSWICGIYDAADYDDVVVLITSEAGGVTPSLLPEFLQGLVVAGILQHTGARVPTATVSTLHSRAPPA